MVMRVVLPIVILSGLLPCFGQQKDGYHVFTDKNGKTISATGSGNEFRILQEMGASGQATFPDRVLMRFFSLSKNVA